MSANKSIWGSTQGIAAIGMIGAVSYFLFMEHQEHIFEFLPYLIFLLCPLMHLFMHKGHSHSHSNRDQEEISHNSSHESKVPGTATKAYEKGIIICECTAVVLVNRRMHIVHTTEKKER